MTSSLLYAGLTSVLALTAQDAVAGDVLLAASGPDCAKAASEVVQQYGGQLLSARPAGDGKSCVIVVLIQAKGAERPRKVQVQVPL